MDQLGIFGDPPNSGRETSKKAAEEIKPTAATLRAQVRKFIDDAGERGATDHEIQAALRMNGNTERPRRKELEQAGLVVDSGRTRPTASGRNAVVWVTNLEMDF